MKTSIISSQLIGIPVYEESCIILRSELICFVVETWRAGTVESYVLVPFFIVLVMDITTGMPLTEGRYLSSQS